MNMWTRNPATRTHPLLRAGVWAALSLAPGLLLGWFAVCAPIAAQGGEHQPPGTVILDAHGTVLQRDARNGLRIPVPLESIAPIMQQATVSAEDQRFWEHPGIDPIAITRALLSLGSQRSGASTITQQLARGRYLNGSGEPLLVRKAHEALLAIQIEGREPKDQILGEYLNSVYYGRGAYGIEAAARVFFGVSAANLDLAQAAYLAGLPQLPGAYDPANDPSLAKARQAYVLARLLDDGQITTNQVESATGESLYLLPPLAPVIGPHFVQFALGELARVRPDLAGKPGLIIETTLDAGLQQEAERIIGQQVTKLADRNVTNAAAVSIDPRDGRIVVMAGSAGFDDAAHAGQVNMTVALRQPGSALKPFLYAAAMEHGFTPATQLLDVPSSFPTPDGTYVPLDYDRRFRGPVSLRTALASSLNIPAVRTLDAIGIDTFLEMAHRAGLATLTDSERYGLALTLGGGEVRLLDLANAYSIFATGGRLPQPYAVSRVRDVSGKVLYEHVRSEPAQVLDPAIAYLVADILDDRDARIPGFGEVTPLDLPFRAGVKTGTTTNFRDNWTVGFTPQLVTGVWVGNADGAPMHDVSGVDGAAPIWRALMAASDAGASGWLERPGSIVEATVCDPTGLQPGTACPTPRRELFVAGTQPHGVEHYYVRRPDGQLLVNPPPEARSWAAGAGLTVAFNEPAPALHVVQPPANSVLFIAPELSSQELILRATAPPGATNLSFQVDGAPAGTAPGPDARVRWRLEPGTHHVEVTAAYAGETLRASSTYEVRTR